MWGDAGPNKTTDEPRGHSVVVDLLLLALVPALVAVSVSVVVGLDRWTELGEAEDRRDRLVAVEALAELRGLVAADLVFETAAPPADATLAAGLGTSAEAVRSAFDPVVGTLVDLDVDALTGRPASLETVLEAVAAASASTSGALTSDADSGSLHAVASARIDALMLEVGDAEAAQRVEPGLVVALAHAEQAAAEVVTIVSGDTSQPSVAEIVAAASADARLEQLLARLSSELPPPDARRLAATVAPVSTVELDEAGRPVAPDLGDAAGRMGELRALRHDHAAASAASAAAEVDTLLAQLRVGVVAAIAVALALCAAVARAASRMLGGLNSLDGQIRRLGAGDLSPATDPLPRSPEIRQLWKALDAVGGSIHAALTSFRRLGEDTVDAAAHEPVPTDGSADDATGAHASELTAAITDRLAPVQAMLRGLRSREEFAQGLIESTDEAIFTVGEDGSVTWANAAAAQMFSVAGDQLTGSALIDLAHRLPLLADLPVGMTNADATVTTASGENRSVLVSTRLVGDDEHPVVAVFARDISERRELEHQLSHQATHDDLTGLGNRASLVAELDRARARAQRSGQGFGLLFIDLDRFKLVNDTLGHRTGDLVLRQIADRLRSATRDSDFVARNGGDEFIVIAEEATDIATVVRLADRIQEELAVPLVIDDDAIPVSASIGVTWLDADDDNSLDQLRNADVAMYQAKSSGPGQVRVFDEDMRNWVEQRFDLERALRRAVGRGELEAFVQPIIDLRTGRVTSAEMLSRWTLEDGREIPPDAFIEVAEDSTLVVEIGRWVLDRAAQLLSTWEHDRRLAPIGLSVNISGRHIDHPNVVADVSDALRRWGADPRLLAIEITETSLLRDLEEAAATLRQLHDLGVSISVDDFGVGYASLRYLRELPVELVKIDRSIVAGFERVDSDTVIVTMLSRLADVLDISIVAEGVETEEQRERLADIGCHYAQGFLFAPAMAVPEFETWLAHWERQHTHPARWHQLLND